MLANHFPFLPEAVHPQPPLIHFLEAAIQPDPEIPGIGLVQDSLRPGLVLAGEPFRRPGLRIAGGQQ